MAEDAQSELLHILGIQRLDDDTQPELLTRGEPVARASDAEQFRAYVQTLRDELSRAPASALEDAPAWLGADPTADDALRVLDEADAALADAPRTARLLAANRGVRRPAPSTRGDGAPPLDPPIDPPIDPSIHKFETLADGPAWALTALEAWWFRRTHPKPPLPRHSGLDDFRYPLQTGADGNTTLALFSDWGTGYYHSRYIARSVGAMRPGQAIHLGDVYYTGRQKEVDEYLAEPLEAFILAHTPMYALNANHEMDSHGIAYFDFLKRKRERGGANGRVRQPQQSSYFCLENPHYQVVAIDTAYTKNGRITSGTLDWIAHQLERGKRDGKINILLSQNEPYHQSKTRRLLRELEDLAPMIDLWFWGDQHYAALYGPGPDIPFFGSCIGHGGYPYRKKEVVELRADAAHYIWGETGVRMPERDDMGSNGFCVVTLEASHIDLRYVDWREQQRHQGRLWVKKSEAGVLTLTADGTER